jgi:hypothetical protein
MSIDGKLDLLRLRSLGGFRRMVSRGRVVVSLST